MKRAEGSVTFFLFFLLILVFTGCGSGSAEKSLNTGTPSIPPMPASTSLKMIDDESFNALSEEDRIYVAKKLYTTFYKGKDINALKSEIDSGKFISDFWIKLHSSNVPQPDLDKIYQDTYTIPYEARAGDRLFEKRWRVFSHIASTLYYTKLSLDFYNEWMAYVMEQTILFSPAYEVESVTPFPELIASNHERIVRDLKAGRSIKDLVLNHMKSKENWARFRSPEDNGREMLEIWLYDYEDRHVPLAAKALKNWRWELRREKNAEGKYGDIYRFYNDANNKDQMNTEGVELLGKTIVTGSDFYKAVVEHSQFLPTVIDRLVNSFFPTLPSDEKRSIAEAIEKTKPTTFREIFDRIIFSKKFLFESNRLKNLEEIYMGLAHLLDMEPDGTTFRYLFTDGMKNSNQLPLTYKLGRPDEGVSDSDSVIRMHQYVRTNIFLNRRGSRGWNSATLRQRYSGATLEAYLDDMFLDIVGRKMSDSEKQELVSLAEDAGVSDVSNKKGWNRFAVMLVTFDYFSRLSEIYTYRKAGVEK